MTRQEADILAIEIMHLPDCKLGDEQEEDGQWTLLLHAPVEARIRDREDWEQVKKRMQQVQ